VSILTSQLSNASPNLRIAVARIKSVRLPEVDRVKARVPLRVAGPLSSSLLTGEAVAIHAKRPVRIAGIFDRRGRDTANCGGAGGSSGSSIIIRGLV